MIYSVRIDVFVMNAHTNTKRSMHAWYNISYHYSAAYKNTYPYLAQGERNNIIIANIILKT